MDKINKLEQMKERFNNNQEIYNDIKYNVGRKLTELRNGYGFTQQEVASIVGITRSTLSYYEKAERTVDIEILYKLCAFYNVSIDYMVGIKKTSAPEFDYEEIETHRQLGFTNEAIENLIGDLDTVTLLNDIVMHKKFKLLQELTHYSRYTRYESMDTEYRSFLTSKLLYEMISEIYEEWYIDNDTRIKTLSEDEKEDLLKSISNYKLKRKEASDLLMFDYDSYEEKEYQIEMLYKKLMKYF